MSKFSKFKSKKGFSLAYALVVCLFLMLLTGGITTIAIMQANETGSDLNTRQAYISAKSGLDAMESMIKNNAINASDLPSGSVGSSLYYVLYQDSVGGEIKYQKCSDMTEVNNFFATHPSAIIVGGEGTYFKVTKKDLSGRFSVMALNVTGKYNNNVTNNKGDLSFDMVCYEKYTFKANPLPTSPTDRKSVV